MTRVSPPASLTPGFAPLQSASCTVLCAAFEAPGPHNCLRTPPATASTSTYSISTFTTASWQLQLMAYAGLAAAATAAAAVMNYTVSTSAQLSILFAACLEWWPSPSSSGRRPCQLSTSGYDCVSTRAAEEGPNSLACALVAGETLHLHAVYKHPAC